MNKNRKKARPQTGNRKASQSPKRNRSELQSAARSEIGESILKYTALGYFYLAFLIIPLYVEDAYFNISKAKAHIFLALTPLLLVCALAGAAFIRDRSLIPRRNTAVTAFLALGAVALLSCALSDDPSLTFKGLEGWGVGANLIFCLGVFLWLLTRSMRYSQNLWLPVMGVNAVIFLIGIIQSAGVDLFSMRRGIAENAWFYVSTIGHANWFVGYLCIIVTLFAGFYLTCEHGLSQMLYLGLLALGIMNIVCCATDGIFVGLGFCAFFAIPFVFADAERIKRLSLLVFIYGLSLLAYGSLGVFSEKKNAFAEDLSLRMLDPRVGGAIAAFGIIMYLLMRFDILRPGAKVRRYAAAALGLVLLGTAIYFLRDAVVSFSPSWGTNRGKTWTRSVEVFGSLPFVKKLFGVGPGGLKKYYGGLFKQTLLTSHNELLQYLLTTGLAGLGCWLTGWGSVISLYFRKKLWRKKECVFLLPVAAYLGQSLVNSPTVTNVSMLCAVTACLLISIERPHEISRYN